MKKINRWLFALLVLMCSIALTACPNGNETPDPPPAKVNAVAPVFENELSDIQYPFQEAAPVPLNATATVTDSGTITYQWYSNDEENTDTPTILEGEVNASFTPATDTRGIFYYYVVATNTIEDNKDGGTKTASITSRVATIAVCNAENDFTFDLATGTITKYNGTTDVVTIPKSIGGTPVTTIGSRAFIDTPISTVFILDTVTTIGDSAFIYCKSLKSIRIPSSVTSIGKNPFISCSALHSIDIDDANTAYTSFGGNLYNKDKTTLISFSASKGNESFSTIPNTVTAIGNSAFFLNTNLTIITIPNGVETIGKEAFVDNRKLTTVTIPDSIKSIEESGFSFSSMLASVTVHAPTPPTLGKNVFRDTSSDLVIYVPADSVAAYQEATNWSAYKDKIQAIVAP